MYPYNFVPTRLGLNPEEVFVVMPFDEKYEDVFTDLIDPAVRVVSTKLSRALVAYRTKDDPRTISGWIQVLEHSYPAQIVLVYLPNRSLQTSSTSWELPTQRSNFGDKY